MERPSLSDLDPDLMNPKRFLIATLLYVMGPRTMADLVRALGLTWGDLDSNLRRLRDRGFVELRKVLTLKGPRTVAVLTEKGLEEYERLVESLRKLLSSLSSSAHGGR